MYRNTKLTALREGLSEIDERILELDSEAILKAVEAQHGILVERAREIYSFSHLTFQEYFTAKHIVENSKEESLAKLISKHLNDEKWREVFLIISGMLPQADDFLNLIRRQIGRMLRKEPRITQFFTIYQRKEEKHRNDFSFNYYRGISERDVLSDCLQIPAVLSRILSVIQVFNAARRINTDGELSLNFNLLQKGIDFATDIALYTCSNLNNSFAHNLKRELLGGDSGYLHIYSTENVSLASENSREHRNHNTAQAIAINKALENSRKLIFDTANSEAVDEVLELSRKEAPALAILLASDYISLAKLVEYIRAAQVLIECLKTQCYISRELRQDILFNLFSFEPNNAFEQIDDSS